MAAGLKRIPTSKLVPDPDVQLAFSLSASRLKRLVNNWNDDLVGVLRAAPLGDGSKMYGVIDGRHRLLAGKERGVVQFRVDAYADPLDPETKAKIKLGLDRERRQVHPIEHFLISVTAKEPEATEIMRMVEQYEYIVGWAPNRPDSNVIMSPTTLRMLHSLGILEDVLVLMGLWRNEPKVTSQVWLQGLGYFVALGFGDRLTEDRQRRLAEVIPAKVIRQATGMAESLFAQRTSEIPRLIARELGRAAGLQLAGNAKKRAEVLDAHPALFSTAGSPTGKRSKHTLAVVMNRELKKAEAKNGKKK